MIEATFHKVKLWFYFIFMLILFAVLFAPIYFMLSKGNFSATVLTFLVFLLLIQFILLWTIYMLALALKEKWVIRFDPESIQINKSCGHFSFNLDEISEVNLVVQGGMPQLGIKIKERKKWFRNLTSFKKIWILLNRLFTRNDIVIPLYMLNESSTGLYESLNMLLQSNQIEE